jgi:hemerythrin-like domain-containing protein
MDIFTRIMNDHITVKKLFEHANNVVSPTQRKQIFIRIKHELKIHSDTEEKVFYNALLKAAHARGGDNGIIITQHHSESDHREIAAMIDTVDKAEPGSPTWNKAFRTLQQLIDHHVENEENRVFAMARRIFPHMEVNELGDAMHRLKQELQPGITGYEESDLVHRIATTNQPTTKETFYAEC